MAIPSSHRITSVASLPITPSPPPPPPPPSVLLPPSTDLHSHHKLVITGGRHLSGHVPIAGSKNSALAVLAGTLCCSTGASIIRGVPDISDARAMASILRSLGATVEARGGGEVAVDSTALSSVAPAADLVGRIRAGFFVLGPLVARFGEAEVAFPGGCRIGARPVDLYLRGLSALGAIVELRHGKVYVRTENGKGLVGGRFHLDYPSVGASETLMMAASMADGVSVLTNVAQEPEVADLARFLIACGAKIKGAGTSTLVIGGRKSLHGAQFTVIPDRIEAGTFMIAAAITRSCISLSPVDSSHLTSIMNKLSLLGCRISQKGQGAIEVSAKHAASGADLEGLHLKTSTFPGFPTDLQPQFMALLTTCNGSSIVEESIFEDRMHHVKEMCKLGARIKVDGSVAFVEGKRRRSVELSGSQVEARDLRGGAALVLAGMAAKGVTQVTGVGHIDRGYDKFEAKLVSLGADIRREVIFTDQTM